MQQNVTFHKVIKVRVIPMKVRDTETRFQELIIKQQNTPGFLGAVFLKAGMSGMFLVSLRFANRDALQKWESGNGNKELHQLLETEKAVILSEDFYDADEFIKDSAGGSPEITFNGGGGSFLGKLFGGKK